MIKKVFMVVTVLVLIMLSGPTWAIPGDKLCVIDNESFEDANSAGNPMNAKYWYWYYNNGGVKRSNTLAYDGSYAIEVPAGGSASSWSLTGRLIALFPTLSITQEILHKDSAYTASCWVYPKAGTNGELRLTGYSGTVLLVKSVNFSTLPVNQWSQVTVAVDLSVLAESVVNAVVGTAMRVEFEITAAPNGAFVDVFDVQWDDGILTNGNFEMAFFDPTIGNMRTPQDWTWLRNTFAERASYIVASGKGSMYASLGYELVQATNHTVQADDQVYEFKLRSYWGDNWWSGVDANEPNKAYNPSTIRLAVQDGNNLVLLGESPTFDTYDPNTWATVQLIVDMTTLDSNLKFLAIGKPLLAVIQCPNATWDPFRQDGAQGPFFYDNFDAARLIVRPLKCGDWGYFDADLNQDCRVDFEDFALFGVAWVNNMNDLKGFVADWLGCTEPQAIGCIKH